MSISAVSSGPAAMASTKPATPPAPPPSPATIDNDGDHDGGGSPASAGKLNVMA